MPESTIDVPRLKRIRRNNEISARQLSLAIGANEGYVRNLEAGRYKTVSIAIVASLAKELDVGIDALLPQVGPQWTTRQRFSPKPHARIKSSIKHRSCKYLMPDYADSTRLSKQGWSESFVKEYMDRRYWREPRSEDLEIVIQPLEFLAVYGDISRLTKQTILGLTSQFSEIAKIVASALPFDSFESVVVYDNDLVEVRVSPNCVLSSYHAPTVHIVKTAIDHCKRFVTYDMEHVEENHRFAKKLHGQVRQKIRLN